MDPVKIMKNLMQGISIRKKLVVFFPSAWKRLGQASILSKNAYAHSLIHFFEMKNFFEYKEALHFHPLKLRKKKN